MNTKSFWKTFAVVFIAAFAANAAVAYLWSTFFHESRWQWDTTTATAVVAGLAVTYLLRPQDGEDKSKTQ